MKEIFSKASRVMTKPSRFFEATRRESKLTPSMVFLAVFSIVLGVFMVILFVARRVMLGKLLPPAPVSWILASGTFVTVYIATIVYVLFSIIILHIVLKLFKFDITFVSTSKAIIYGSTPQYLFGLIPFVYTITIFYGIYLTSVGISKYSRASFRKSFTLLFFLTAFSLVLWFLVSGLDAILGPYSSDILTALGVL